MRIVHVVRQFPPGVGGLEEVAAALVEAQAGAGHDVRVATLDRIFSNPEERLVARESWMGAEIIRLPFRGSNRYPIAPTVLGAVRDADIVHVHAIDFFFDFLMLTRPLHGRRMIATTHGGFFHTQVHARLKRIWFSTITRASASAYGAIAACSAADYEMFAPICGAHLRLIENGVDIAKFADRASRAPAKRIVAIGRFSANKRLDRLLDAMVELVRADSAWGLDIVGGESDWTAARLEQEIARRGLSSSVRVHVGANNEAVARLMGQASLFASASEYEGFGLSLIEALSAGLAPVVEANAAFKSFATRAPDVALTDFSSPGRAAAEIASAYARLSADPAAARRRMIAAAEPFAWPGVVKRYQDLYEEVA